MPDSQKAPRSGEVKTSHTESTTTEDDVIVDAPDTDAKPGPYDQLSERNMERQAQGAPQPEQSEKSEDD